MNKDLTIIHTKARGIPVVTVRSHGISTTSKKGEEHAIKTHNRKVNKILKQSNMYDFTFIKDGKTTTFQVPQNEIKL
jgi:hypothetical protein